MSYGYFPSKTRVFSVYQYPAAGGASPQTATYNEGKTFARSGTNSATSLSNTPKGVPRPLITVVRTLNKGPRLSYQIFVPRLKRWVWARQPIQVTRLVKAPYVKRKSLKGSNLPSNALNYEGNTMSYYGLNQTISTKHDSGPEVIAQGDGLWGAFNSWGGGTVGGINPINHMGRGPDRYHQIVDDLTNELIPILYDKVKNQDVNLAQALAEYRQSAGMFVETLTRCGNALLALKKGRLTRAASLLFPKTKKELANDWLLFQYGIKPLLSDIDGAAKMLAIPEDRYFDIIVRRKRKVPGKRVEGSAGVGYSSAWFETTDVYSELEVEVKYKVRLKITSPTANVEREMARLGFGNLNSVAWEVIPWSFIIDWVLPIGDYLNNLDAFSGLTVVSAHKTTFVKETVTWSRIFGGYQQGWRTAASSPMGYVNERVLVRREVNIPIPPLPTPDFKNPFSTGHFANALALFTQLRRK